jgi:hypothetical protein
MSKDLGTGPPKPQDHEKAPYPKYAEYEVIHGKNKGQIYKDKWADFKNPYSKT